MMVCCIGDFSFMGSLIIEEVIKDLVTFHGLSTASTLFLAGSRYHVIFTTSASQGTTTWRVKISTVKLSK